MDQAKRLTSVELLDVARDRLRGAAAVYGVCRGAGDAVRPVVSGALEYAGNGADDGDVPCQGLYREGRRGANERQGMDTLSCCAYSASKGRNRDRRGQRTDYFCRDNSAAHCDQAAAELKESDLGR